MSRKGQCDFSFESCYHSANCELDLGHDGPHRGNGYEFVVVAVDPAQKSAFASLNAGLSAGLH